MNNNIPIDIWEYPHFHEKTLILFLTLFANHKNLFAFIWKMQIFQEKWIIFALEYLVGTTYMSMLENIFAISSKMEAEDKTSKIATKVWEDCILDQAYGKWKISSNWFDFTNFWTVWNLTKSIFQKIILWCGNLKNYGTLKVDWVKFFEIFQGWIPKAKFRAFEPEMLAVFVKPKWPKLISRKIRVIAEGLARRARPEA